MQPPVATQTAAVVRPAATAEAALRTELPMLILTVGGSAAVEMEWTVRVPLPIEAVILMALARIAAHRAAAAAAALAAAAAAAAALMPPPPPQE